MSPPRKLGPALDLEILVVLLGLGLELGGLCSWLLSLGLSGDAWKAGGNGRFGEPTERGEATELKKPSEPAEGARRPGLPLC